MAENKKSSNEAALKKTQRINGSAPDEKYFEWLVSAAADAEILTEADIERIQSEILSLLAKEVDSYNGGESSSIKDEQAQGLLDSIIYTVSVELKGIPCADDAAQKLCDTSIAGIFAEGKKLVYHKLSSAKRLFMLVSANRLETESEAYNGTVYDAIKGFFKLYSPEFAAQETHITADYPLYNLETSCTGIEFIEKYLKAVYCENLFCSHFESEDIHALLCGVEEGYEYLLLNIFEQVLIAALGCACIGKPVHSLRLSDEDIKKLDKDFSVSDADILKKLNKALDVLLSEMGISNEGLVNYIRGGLGKIAELLSLRRDNPKLSPVFVSPSCERENDEAVTVSFGGKADDEKYREIIEELICCRNSSDKLALIMREVNSLGDLEDIFVDAELNEKEIIAILGKLNIHEVAALRKRNDLKIYSGAQLDKQELIAVSAIDTFIEKQTSDYQTRINELYAKIKIDE